MLPDPTGVGFFVFIYMLIVKPAGELVVTYEYRGEGEPPAPASAPGLEDWGR